MIYLTLYPHFFLPVARTEVIVESGRRGGGGIGLLKQIDRGLRVVFYTVNETPQPGGVSLFCFPANLSGRK